MDIQFELIITTPDKKKIGTKVKTNTDRFDSDLLKARDAINRAIDAKYGPHSPQGMIAYYIDEKELI